jgi:hypothetical protein
LSILLGSGVTTSAVTPRLMKRVSSALITAKSAKTICVRIISGLALTASLMVVLFVLPSVLVGVRKLPLNPKDRFDAEAAIRGALIQLLGGGILVAGLYFTARGFRLSREGHITDRYSKAVEQLGNPNLDVRIGGIYALERLARDSSLDRETVVYVLATFIREHTRVGSRKPSSEPVGADVQAALSVLGRRPDAEKEQKKLDFYYAGLNEATMHGDFRNAMFYYCRLDKASFAGSKIDGAGLSFCTALGAAFSHCSARKANFVNAEYKAGWFLAADLTDADFYGTDLSKSDFGRRYRERGEPPLPPATVTRARFTKAKLSGTILRGVDLRTAVGLTREQLAEAFTDENTLLPDHWGEND